jgi:hypothetical protein
MCAVLSGMMSYGDGYAGGPLQRAEVAQQFGHWARLIFIEGVKSHEGIKDQQSGSMEIDRGSKFFTIAGAVQTQRIGPDNANVDLLEV